MSAIRSKQTPSTTTMGSGEFLYQVEEDWGKLPDGWRYIEVAAVGVDSKDWVYVFNRSEHPMIVFDRDGSFLQSWGEGVFSRPHGLTVGSDDALYCTDDLDHTVKKCTVDGEVLLTLGSSGTPSGFHSELPFNRCTNVAVSSLTNEIYVADGYCNARVHKYSEDGRLLFSWGESGTELGQFNIVHNIRTDRDGYVYVADRDNHRVQIFDPNGKFETQWVNMARPCGLFIGNAPQQLCYVGELGAALWPNDGAPGLGPRISVFSLDGKPQARLGDDGPGEEPRYFLAPHGLAVDSAGDIYVAEVSWSLTGKFLDPPRELRCFRKLVKKS